VANGDQIFVVEQSVMYLDQEGGEVDHALLRCIELMNHPTGEHGFDILNNDEGSRAIIRRTIEFIRDGTFTA